MANKVIERAYAIRPYYGGSAQAPRSYGLEFMRGIPVTKYSRLPDICHYSWRAATYILGHKVRG